MRGAQNVSSNLWRILPHLLSNVDGEFLIIIAAAAEVTAQIWRHQPMRPAAAQQGLLGSLPRLSWPETLFLHPHLGAVFKRGPPWGACAPS